MREFNVKNLLYSRSFFLDNLMTKTLNVFLDDGLAKLGVKVCFVLASGTLKQQAALLSQRLLDLVQPSLANPGVLDHPHLRGYRTLHAHFGIDDKSLIPAPESLINIYLSQGRLRTLGPIVDLYNAIALKHLISAGAHDATKLGDTTMLSINRGFERFKPLGQKKKITLPASEYSYKTDHDRPICRLECKQANETKIRADNTCWLFVLQGNAAVSTQGLRAARDDLVGELVALTHHCTFDSQLLSARTLSGLLRIAPSEVNQ